MKKTAFTLSIFVLALFWLYPKDQHFNINKTGAKSESKQVISNRLDSTLETLIDVEVPAQKVFSKTPEAYLFEAKEIRRCKRIPKTKDELSVWLNNANELGESDEYIDDVLSRFERCSSLAFAFDDFISPLFNSIALGSDAAVEELWSVSDKEYLHNQGWYDLSREEVIAKRVKFNQLKYQLSERIALTGGEHSILRLVKGYKHYDPESGQPNYLKAMAYVDFGLKIVESNELYLKLDFLKQVLLKHIGLQELQQAQALTLSLLEKYEQNRNKHTSKVGY